MNLRLSTRLVDGVTIVDCSGRLVFGEETALLRDTVKSQLNENKNMVLNLAGVNYVDSGGVGTLVGLYASVFNAGGIVKLANLSKRVRDLLQVTKLVTVFEVFDNEQAAVQSFAKRAVA